MSIAETPHLMREERMGMRSVCAFSHLTSLPGIAMLPNYSVSVKKLVLWVRTSSCAIWGYI